MNDLFLTSDRTGLQAHVLARLQSLPALAGVSMFARQDQAVQDAMNEALQSLGIAIAVHVPDVMRDETQGQAGGRMIVRLQVEVIENELFNRGPEGTGKPIGLVQTQVYAALKGTTFAALPVCGPLIPEGGLMEPFKGDDDALHVMVTFSIPWALNFDPKVSSPVITFTGTTVTVACATAGAAIYWTQDGSYPWTGNTSASLYADPFDLSASAVVVAVAYKSGLTPSDEAAKSILVPTSSGKILRPDGTSFYLRPDGISTYLHP